MPKQGEPKPADAAPEIGAPPAPPAEPAAQEPPLAAAPVEPVRPPEPAPKPATPDAPAPAPSLMPAVVGGVVGAALSAVGLLLFGGGLSQTPAPPPAPAALVQPADIERLTQRIGALDALPTRLAALEQAARRLEERLGGVEARPAPAASPAPAVDLAPVQQALAALRRDLDQLPRAAADGNAVPALPAIDLGPVEREIARLSTGLNGLETALGALTRRVEATPPPAPPAAPGVDRLGALAVASATLKSAVDRGGPFATELQAVRALGITGADVEALAQVAAAGVAGPQALARRFQALARGVIDAAAPPAEGTLDRLMQGASRLISVRPTGEPAGTTPEAIVARIETRLGRGDLAGALADFDALPEASRRAAGDFRAALAARVEADRLMARVATEVARSLAPRG